jgi:chemotaxis protein MotC
MTLRATCLGLMTLICLTSGQAEGVFAQEQVESAPPYLMIRSLQTIQDKVINGDLNSVEMQRYLLDEIDKRLRTIDMAVFDDPRNVDAALIYAMSGGNPATLDILAERDIEGNFDNRLTSILRRYLSGRGATTLKQLKEVVPEYRNTRIGPYIELIGANALMEKETDIALKFFDWARDEAPGTIIEEAALRRSLGITSKKGDTVRALPYARRYARRYMNSPYASSASASGKSISGSDAARQSTATGPLPTLLRARRAGCQIPTTEANWHWPSSTPVSLIFRATASMVCLKRSPRFQTRRFRQRTVS